VNETSLVPDLSREISQDAWISDLPSVAMVLPEMLGNSEHRIRLMKHLVIIVALCIATSAMAQQSSGRSFYDRNGSYAGSVRRNPDSSSSSFTDRNGSFAGSATRNSDGSTSYFDRNGHFSGSARPR
jgi:hypothetical protein